MSTPTTTDPETRFANQLPTKVQRDYEEALRLATQPTTEAAPAAATAPGNDGQQPTPAAPAAPQETPAAAPAETPAKPQEPPTLPDDSLDTWRQRARVFQGRLAAKAGLEEELRQARARIAALEAQRQPAAGPAVSSTAAAVPERTVTPPRVYKAKDITEADVKREFDAEQIEDLGMDLLRNELAMNRTMAERMKAELAALVAGNGNGHGTSKDVQELRDMLAKQRDDQFFAELTQLCPSWQAMNAHPQFAAFEAAVEPRSGETFGVLLGKARAAADATRAMNVLEDFRVFVSGPPKPAEAKPIEQPHVRIMPGVAEQASIAHAASAGPSGASTKRRYTVQEWNALNQKVINLQQTSPQEAEELFQELVAAVQENRVSGLVG